MDKIVLFPLIAVNEILTNAVTICSCFDTQLRHGQTTQQYFRVVDMSSRKKRKRSSCPFVPKRAVKRKKGNCFDKDWVDKPAASDNGSYYK